MAKTLYDDEVKGYRAKVGQIVYSPYKPGIPGVVMEVAPVQSKFGETWWMATVKWINGKVSREKSIFLNDFDELIAEHEKRVRTHRAMREKLLNIVNKEG